jgi:Flp pilus assembly protein TadG
MRATRAAARRGKFLAFTVLFSVVLLGFAALAVDIGVLAAARAQLKTVADGAALAGARQLVSDNRLQTNYTPTTEATAATNKAIAIGQANSVLGQSAVVQSGDVEVGYKQTQSNGQPYYDPTDATWKTVTDPTTNSVRVTATRDGSHVGVVPAYFSKIWGSSGSSASVTSTATVEIFQIGGYTSSGPNSSVLPIAMLKDSYDAMFNTPITDNYDYHPPGIGPSSVTNGPDGEPEALLYPKGTTAGNYGTVNIPSGSSNSTNVLGNQISNGIPPSELQFGSSTFTLSGDTGISSGIKDNLSGIIGKPVAVLLYTQVSGNGNNAQYSIVGFGAVRIVNVDFQGSNKNVVIQRALISDPTATPNPTGPSTWTQGGLVRLHLSR